MRIPKCTILVDESQNFKGHGNTRTGNLHRIGKFAQRRYLFSGEPAPQGYEDYFSQFWFLDPNIIGHASLTSFRGEYCIMGGYNGKEVMEYRGTEKLMERLAPHCEFIDISKCMDMPPRSWHKGRCPVTQQQRDLYEEVKTEFLLTVERVVTMAGDRGAVVETIVRECETASSRFIAMQQVSCGFVYTDMQGKPGAREVVRLTDMRARYSLEELALTQPKALVWARYHEDLALLTETARALKVDYVEVSGRAQADNDVERFKRDPDCRLFIATAAKASESLNLQVAHRSVYHSNTFNYGHRKQSEARTWRAGQREPCDYWDVIGLPIDRLYVNNLDEKRDMTAEMKTVAGLAALAQQVKVLD